jgi:prepilin-type N-terminal cleavage/methylation domain-containing protein
MLAMSELRKTQSAGFTLVELLVAMSVFSMMLLIVVSGFLNVIKINNQAIASNLAQDNAKSAMDEMIQGIRNSAGAITPSPAGRLCLAGPDSGQPDVYYLDPATQALMRSKGCNGALTNTHRLTSSDVKVVNFEFTIAAAGPDIVKREVQLKLMVASNNSTTTGVGAATKCGPTEQQRTFCSVVTLTSGAVPR